MTKLWKKEVINLIKWISLLKDANGLMKVQIDKTFDVSNKITNMTDVFKILAHTVKIQNSITENVYAIILNGKSEVEFLLQISKGLNDSSVFTLNELIPAMLLTGSKHVILAHNHPNLCEQPSPDDITVTEQIEDILNKLNLQLIDHIVVTRTTIKSIKKAGD